MTTTATSEIDVALADLSAKSDEWVNLPISRKLQYLAEIRELVTEHAAEWVQAAVEGKQIPEGSPLQGEEWISGPYPVLGWIEGCASTIGAIESGSDPLADFKTSKSRSGQVVAEVYPTNIYETLLLNGYHVEVWMQTGVTLDNVRDTVGVAYQDSDRPGRVSLVLGAGNITSIPALDLLYKLYAELEVVALKLNPVTDYLSEVFQKIFAPLIDDGYLRILSGGADVGTYLTTHDLVESVHMTGSAKTHDTIVFGPGEEGRARRAENEPILTKTITSELGGVSPTIVVPGPWSKGDISFQAEHIATQKLHNSGFNCIASQVLIMPEGWGHGDALMDALRETIATVEDRPAYYPGAEDRHAAAVEQHSDPHIVGVDGRRAVLAGYDSAVDHYVFSEEFFAPVLATTSLPAASASEFLKAAVEFSNDKLYGTLGANILVHPATAKELGPELRQAVADLRYGSVGINAWTGVAYLITRATWGAAPGHTLDDVQSGIGVVHNSVLFDRAEKSVAWGPFRPFPRNMLHGQFHISPRPPWFVTNKTSDVTSKRLTYYAADGKVTRLPGIFVSALRG